MYVFLLICNMSPATGNTTDQTQQCLETEILGTCLAVYVSNIVLLKLSIYAQFVVLHLLDVAAIYAMTHPGATIL